MNRTFLFVAGLALASAAQAQTPYKTIMNHIAVDYATAGAPSGTATDQVEATPGPLINGERALVGRIEKDDVQIGSRSSFHTEVRGDITSNAWGKAEFGAIDAVDESSATFVISLGVCGEQSAVLFTRRNGAPLAVGRYRISEPTESGDEIMALVLTGSPTRPTGVFRGQSGWLVVDGASDQLIAGQFEIDAVGFTAAEPEHENQHVSVTGSFSATTGSSSFRICEDAE
ncbi:MAG: hypothetical protein ACJ8BF_08295 [Gemmatimonadales bacterium]